jgi:hypothetical protein
MVGEWVLFVPKLGMKRDLNCAYNGGQNGSKITPQLWECGKLGWNMEILYIYDYICLYTIYLGK